jgi:hypothetical protein
MDGRPLIPAGTIDAHRPIFGVSAVAARVKDPSMTLRPLSGPPNYGAASATMVVGNRWYELSLIDGSVRSGVVPGHTAVNPGTPDDSKARRMLRAQVASRGFAVETDAAGDQ